MEPEGTLPWELEVTQDAIDNMEDWNEEVNNSTENEATIATPGGLPAISMGAPFVGDVDEDSVASFGSEGDRIVDELERGLI